VIQEYAKLRHLNPTTIHLTFEGDQLDPNLSIDQSELEHDDLLDAI
jgi:hypothetical protein